MIQFGCHGAGVTLITYEEGCYYKIEIPIYRFFGIFSSVFGIFCIWNTDFGIGIGILKYLGIQYRYRLPTQDYFRHTIQFIFALLMDFDLT